MRNYGNRNLYYSFITNNYWDPEKGLILKIKRT